MAQSAGTQMTLILGRGDLSLKTRLIPNLRDEPCFFVG